MVANKDFTAIYLWLPVPVVTSPRCSVNLSQRPTVTEYYRETRTYAFPSGGI